MTKGVTESPSSMTSSPLPTASGTRTVAVVANRPEVMPRMNTAFWDQTTGASRRSQPFVESGSIPRFGGANRLLVPGTERGLG